MHSVTFLFKNPCNSFDCSIPALNDKMDSSEREQEGVVR